MSKASIRKEIAALINSIKEHSDNIGDREHIPQLELELILHKIEKLYQKSIVYNHLNSLDSGTAERKADPPAEKKQEAPPEPKKEPVTAETNKVVDLFGSEVPPAAEKPKPEKKAEKKEEKKEEKKPEPKPVLNT